MAIAGGRFAQAEVMVTEPDKAFLSWMFEKYKIALEENIDDWFSRALGILECFCVFNPLTVPPANSPKFKVYSEDEVRKIATHFYPKDKGASHQLKDEWQNFKHNLLKMRRVLPKDMKEGSCTKAPIDWMLSTALCQRHTNEFFFVVRTKLADVIHSVPITNTSPERCAMALKRIKIKLKSNRLSQNKVECPAAVLAQWPWPWHSEGIRGNYKEDQWKVASSKTMSQNTQESHFCFSER